jgi:uncharacterized SAM-dependent methyltransferase
LQADFIVENFDHCCSYDPFSWAGKSYLISLKDAEVTTGEREFHFKEGEAIWMEISQKFTMDEIHEMGINCGFLYLDNVLDNKNWFTDSIWCRI